MTLHYCAPFWCIKHLTLYSVSWCVLLYIIMCQSLPAVWIIACVTFWDAELLTVDQSQKYWNWWWYTTYLAYWTSSVYVVNRWLWITNEVYIVTGYRHADSKWRWPSSTASRNHADASGLWDHGRRMCCLWSHLLLVSVWLLLLFILVAWVSCCYFLRS